MKDNAIALNTNMAPTMPPTVHPNNRKVGASSIGDILQFQRKQLMAIPVSGNARPRQITGKTRSPDSPLCTRAGRPVPRYNVRPASNSARGSSSAQRVFAKAPLMQAKARLEASFSRDYA
jgi:hypothetical protein